MTNLAAVENEGANKELVQAAVDILHGFKRKKLVVCEFRDRGASCRKSRRW